MAPTRGDIAAALYRSPTAADYSLGTKACNLLADAVLDLLSGAAAGATTPACDECETTGQNCLAHRAGATTPDDCTCMPGSYCPLHSPRATTVAPPAPTVPTRAVVREQVRAALLDAGGPFTGAQVNRVANAVMLLLTGNPKYANTRPLTAGSSPAGTPPEEPSDER